MASFQLLELQAHSAVFMIVQGVYVICGGSYFLATWTDFESVSDSDWNVGYRRTVDGSTRLVRRLRCAS